MAKQVFSVSAYIENKGSILLVNHVKQRQWVPIGGRIEADETPQEAIVREVREETGLDPGFDYQFRNTLTHSLNFGSTPGLFAYEEHAVLPEGLHMCFSFLLQANTRLITRCAEYTDEHWVSHEDFRTKHPVTRNTPLNVQLLLGSCFYELYEEVSF